MIKKINLIWNTVQFLKPIQIYWRIWLRIKKPSVDLSEAPALRKLIKPLSPTIRKNSSLRLPNVFTFLNESHEISLPSDWNNPDWDKLWLYNLHYFDYLNPVDVKVKLADHQELMKRWVYENPPAHGNGWEPYPTSLRIVNWIKWTRNGDVLDQDLKHSLTIQVRHLCQHLEYHLLGNHLFSNGKALIIAGLFFKGAEADIWLKKGLDIINKEFSEQILDDGGHFELSPMYHSIILEDLLDLINFTRSYDNSLGSAFIASWENLACKMLNWLNLMIHPDGEICLFNDAAIDIAAKPQELFNYASRLNISTFPNGTYNCLLPDTGYARLENQDAVLFADVAKIGPDYLPGHAHADTLNFEFSLFGSRLIVDSGTSCYGNSAERLRQRSTSAHNTVEVDGHDSSEVWGGFRVARRAYPDNIFLNLAEDAIELTASHDGYQRLNKDIVHKRSWLLEKQSLCIKDMVSGIFHRAIGRLHFSPDIEIEETDVQGKCLILRKGNKVAELFAKDIDFKIVITSYHPKFGCSFSTKCIEYEVIKNKPTILWLAW